MRIVRAICVVFGMVLGSLSVMPASATTITEHCAESHRAQVDPIVSPGVPSAHMHVFFGNRTTNAFGIDPNGATTCKEFDDRSAYWVPEVYIAGVPQKLKVAPYWKDDNKTVTAPPFGLQFVTPQAWGQHAAFACTSGGTTYPAPVDCGGKGKLKMRVSFPSCWNGIGTDPASLAYGIGATGINGGTCPPGFAVRIPRLLLQVDFPVSVAVGEVTLSSGPYTTMHADWVNLMPPAQMQSIVDGLN